MIKSDQEVNRITKEVLVKARENLITEISRSGFSGGVARAQNYAPILVDITNAIKIMDELYQEMNAGLRDGEAKKVADQNSADRMAALRAAKAAKKARQELTE